MKRFIAQTRAQPKRLFRRQMDAPARLPMGDDYCGCGDEGCSGCDGLGQTSYQPAGTFTRGVFDQVQPYAIPGYVAAEPDGVNGINGTGDWYEATDAEATLPLEGTPSGGGVFQPEQPWATPDYAVEKSDFGGFGAPQFHMVNMVGVSTAQPVHAIQSINPIHIVSAFQTTKKNIGVFAQMPKVVLPAQYRLSKQSTPADIAMTMAYYLVQMAKWLAFSANNGKGYLPTKAFGFSVKSLAESGFNAAETVALPELRDLLLKPIMELRGKQITLSEKGLVDFIDQKIPIVDVRINALSVVMDDKGVLDFARSYGAPIPSKRVMIENVIDKLWGETLELLLKEMSTWTAIPCVTITSPFSLAQYRANPGLGMVYWQKPGNFFGPSNCHVRMPDGKWAIDIRSVDTIQKALPPGFVSSSKFLPKDGSMTAQPAFKLQIQGRNPVPIFFTMPKKGAVMKNTALVSQVVKAMKYTPPLTVMHTLTPAPGTTPGDTPGTPGTPGTPDIPKPKNKDVPKPKPKNKDVPKASKTMGKVPLILGAAAVALVAFKFLK